jgi:hypothetical protein
MYGREAEGGGCVLTDCFISRLKLLHSAALFFTVITTFQGLRPCQGSERNTVPVTFRLKRETKSLSETLYQYMPLFVFQDAMFRFVSITATVIVFLYSQPFKRRLFK